MKKLIISITSAFMLLGLLSACGQKATVDEKKPVAEIKTEAQKMDTSALQGEIEAYKGAITAKTADLDKIQAQIKDIPLTEMFGDKAKDLKGQLSNISDSLSNLNERLQVYVDQLKAKQQ